MRVAACIFVAIAAAITAFWAWLGAPVPMPSPPLAAGEKLYCVSYAPFRGDQSPLSAGTHIAAAQIEDDLRRLSATTDCVRTYSVEHGLDQIVPIAARLGLKVMQGIWLSSSSIKNNAEIETAVALTNQHKETVRAVIVGNEVLLRGEMNAPQLAAVLRGVKARVTVPVTYADVWEFWLRAPELATIADFVTVHILPYWEDFPVAAAEAAAHLESIRSKVAVAFPGKEILIGETGWPSEGRMREGALPSRANQARVLHDILNTANAKSYRVNIIEAFDQPWKRRLEGTVGGYWGIYDDVTRSPKFTWGHAVSNRPSWRLQAGAGAVLAALVLAAAWASRKAEPTIRSWAAVGCIALVSGLLVGVTVETLWTEALGLGGFARGFAFGVVAVLCPFIAAAMIASGEPLPGFSTILNRGAVPIAWSFAGGAALLLLTVIAVQTALGFVFDPRYKDFPYAPLASGVFALMLVRQVGTPQDRRFGTSEVAMAACLALSATYVAFNEGFSNWQAQIVVAEFVLLALTLLRVWPWQRTA